MPQMLPRISPMSASSDTHRTFSGCVLQTGSRGKGRPQSMRRAFRAASGGERLMTENVVQRDIAQEAASADSGLAPLDCVREPDCRISLQLLEQSLQARIVAAIDNFVILRPSRDADEV